MSFSRRILCVVVDPLAGRPFLLAFPCLITWPSPFTVNEYLFMVQARGIQIRENVRSIGAQVLEQVVRGAYSSNGTGWSRTWGSGAELTGAGLFGGQNVFTTV